jgi:hypothetical protein
MEQKVLAYLRRAFAKAEGGMGSFIHKEGKKSVRSAPPPRSAQPVGRPVFHPVSL